MSATPNKNNLHIISTVKNKNWFDNQVARLCGANDKIIFIGDAVSSVVDQNMQVNFKKLKLSIYVLQADLKCRGIESLCPSFIQIITDADMVELTINSDQNISW